MKLIHEEIVEGMASDKALDIIHELEQNTVRHIIQEHFDNIVDIYFDANEDKIYMVTMKEDKDGVFHLKIKVEEI